MSLLQPCFVFNYRFLICALHFVSSNCAFRFQLSYHKFNESQRELTVLKRLKQGEIVALISDAGMPGISDPGAELVSRLYILFVFLTESRIK